ncbi:hypothetical protein HPB47_010360 [Ixodes persulcatus]|uniref:Uncharacterized protein n=1 Tax=Ixodes persulcatus TaxID=34615 RepID=A0AC60NZN5_IXOPE|nr:hypothetical protein HPB47_010360 [Ixodes persulcatus]
MEKKEVFKVGSPIRSLRNAAPHYAVTYKQRPPATWSRSQPSQPSGPCDQMNPSNQKTPISEMASQIPPPKKVRTEEISKADKDKSSVNNMDDEDDTTPFITVSYHNNRPSGTPVIFKPTSPESSFWKVVRLPTLSPTQREKLEKPTYANAVKRRPKARVAHMTTEKRSNSVAQQNKSRRNIDCGCAACNSERSILSYPSSIDFFGICVFATIYVPSARLVCVQVALCAHALRPNIAFGIWWSRGAPLAITLFPPLDAVAISIRRPS